LTSAIIASASAGDISPQLQAAKTAAEAAGASAAVSMLGNSSSTVRARCAGTVLLSRARSMLESPWRAFSIALATSASALPSISSSKARVMRLREPLGRPFGLPLRPRSNGRPRGLSGGDTETSTGDDAEASTGDDAEASTGDDAEASTGDDAEASTGDDAEASTGDDAEASTGDDAEASIGDDAEASTGDDAEASTGGTSIGLMSSSFIRFTPKRLVL
jgi:hypothetical protein